MRGQHFFFLFWEGNYDAKQTSIQTDWSIYGVRKLESFIFRDKIFSKPYIDTMYAEIGSLVVAQKIPLEILKTDRETKQGESSKIITEAQKSTSTAQLSGTVFTIHIIFLENFLQISSRLWHENIRLFDRCLSLLKQKCLLPKKRSPVRYEKSWVC